MNIFFGIIIPFIGTTLGASMVFFTKGKSNEALEKLMVGFASGVMIAASIWSLILPAIKLANVNYNLPWLPIVIGFLLGTFLLLFFDTIIPHIHTLGEKAEGLNNNKHKKRTMMLLAITIHNIPEGIAVGVIFAGLLSGTTGISYSSAMALAMGIAIQNFPEGAIVSVPLALDGKQKFKSFVFGTLSGIVEPVAAGITLLLSKLMVPILPYLLSFAAGAMIYAVVEELIPESQMGKHTNLATIGVAIGFLLMMVLDISL